MERPSARREFLAITEEAATAVDACGTNGPATATELAFRSYSRAEVTADYQVHSTNITNVDGSRWKTITAA